jgi:putative DNA primase/helicase
MSVAINQQEVYDQLTASGLIVDHLTIGRMVRCKVEGTRERKGWYSLYEFTKDNGEVLIVGSYGVWSGNDNGARKISMERQNLSADQREAMKARYAADRKKAEGDRQREIMIAAKRAHATWLKLNHTGESEYLKRKGVGAYGVRYTDTGAMVIPAQDNSGTTFGLQFVLPAGHKRKVKTGRDKEFWPVGMEMRGKYFIIGGSPRRTLLVAEGYATAATLHEATGLPVAIAFNANNLLPVAENLKKRYKSVKQLICADDDYIQKCGACDVMTHMDHGENCEHCGSKHGKNNAGTSSAQAAAVAVGGQWVAPVFTIDREGKKITDFNDLHAREGLHVVQQQIEQALIQHGWASDVAPKVGALNSGAGDALKPLLDVEDAVERYSLIYGAGGTMFDHQESALIPKSDVMDICVDHAWREWKLHVDRKVVRLTEVGFDPTDNDPNIKCNLWGGWPTVPKKGDCDVLLDLLRYLCSGEEEKGSDKIYQWVLKWLAYPIQHRGAKMRTALIFHGPQGVGKNLFFEAYSAIYGKYGRIVGQAELDDKFNDWASGKLFMIADEVMARQELFHQKNKIKTLITQENIRINPKNVAAHDEHNHVNLVFLSNETQPLVLEKDDRRFAVIWVPEKLPEEMYKLIADEIKNGGIAALHERLLNLELGDFSEHSKPPMTQSKQDLIDINLDSVQRFMVDWESGEAGLLMVPCHSDDLYKAYQGWCRRNGVSKPRELAQLIGSIKKLRGWAGGRQWVYPDYLFQGEQKQISFIIPPNSLIEPERQQGDKTKVQWFTECYLDFHKDIDTEQGSYREKDE